MHTQANGKVPALAVAAPLVCQLALTTVALPWGAPAGTSAQGFTLGRGPLPVGWHVLHGAGVGS